MSPYVDPPPTGEQNDVLEALQQCKRLRDKLQARENALVRTGLKRGLSVIKMSQALGLAKATVGMRKKAGWYD